MPQRYRRRPYWRLLIPLLALAFYLAGGCADLRRDVTEWVERTFGRPTPREEFAARHRRDPALAPWQAAYRTALNDSLYVALPHRERLSLDTTVGRSAHAYRFSLPPGRLLRIEARGPTPLFGELHRNGEVIVAWDTLANYLSYEAGRAEALTFVVQPPPGRAATFELGFTTAPVLEFPVAGAGSDDIQSFWGASREGGRRRHEGNDIFAPRGTPLVAVTNGRISRVREGGLGGKTVWLRDGEGRGLSYYYAHLDEQLVRTGATVARGDTLGLVGNTGNARTTAPHLHFGIYANGARDPLPYLREADALPAPSRLAPEPVLRVPLRGNHYLRRTPDRDPDNVIRKLSGGEEVFGLGVAGKYYRIHTQGYESGYVNFD